MKTFIYASVVSILALCSQESSAQNCYECGDTLCASITNVRPKIEASQTPDQYRYGYRYMDPNRKPDRVFYLDDEELGKNAVRVEQYYMGGSGMGGYGARGYGCYGNSQFGMGYAGYGYPSYGYSGFGYTSGGMGMYGGYPSGWGGYPYGYRQPHWGFGY